MFHYRSPGRDAKMSCIRYEWSVVYFI